MLEPVEARYETIEQELRTGNYPAAVRVPPDLSSRISAGEEAQVEVIGTGRDQVLEQAVLTLIDSFTALAQTQTLLAGTYQAALPEVPVERPGEILAAAQTRFGNDFVAVKADRGSLPKLTCFQYFSASMLIFFLLTSGLVQALGIMLFAHYAFNVPWGNDPLALALTILPIIFISSALGIIVSCLVRSNTALTSLLLVLFWFMTFLSGGFTAISMLEPVARFTVNKWAFESLAALMTGGGLRDAASYLIPLAAAALVLWLAAVSLYTRRVRHE